MQLLRCPDTLWPLEKHFEAMERVFGYLARNPNCLIPIDVQDPPGRKKANLSYGFDWVEFYPDAVENIPEDMPPPQRKGGKVDGLFRC